MKKFLLSLLTILMLTTSLPVAPIMAEDEETHEHNHNHEEQEENAFLEQEGSFNSEEGEFVAENINPEIEELIYYCDKEEHLHDANCYKILNVLECKEDHLHADTCLKEIKFLICDKEEHLHTDECLDAEYKAKHEELITEPTEEEIALEQAKNGLEGYFLSCDKDEHEHSLDCYEYKEDLVCKNTSEDHEHSDECYSKYYVLSCDKEEHVHTIDCVSKQEEKYEYIDEIPDDLPNDEEINEETPLRMMLRGPLRGSNDTQIEIRQLNVQVFKGGKWIDDKYVKVPYDSAIGQRFAFRVNFALSGVGEIDAYDPQNTDSEGIKIVIPKQILRNRMGDLADTYEMSIPHISEINDDELDVDINYCYYEEGDNLVIVNFKERPAGDNGYFEIAYATSQTTFNYQDMGSSDDFYATLVAVNNGETTEPQESNHIPVYMDTTAKIDETYKDYPKKSDTWNSSWGSKPADADDYFYLEWDIRSYINDKATQPYNLTFTDITTSEYGTSEFVGYKARGSEQYITDNTVTNQTITGRRYDKVLTRHLKADFDPLDYYKIVNNIKVVLTPADLLDPETQASASRPYEYRYHEPVWKYPTGHFQVWKYADGSYRARKGYNVLNERRGTYSRYDLQDWKDSSLEIYDTFDWGVVMEGYPYPWTINAGSDIQDPASYGVTPVTFKVADNTLFFGETNQRQLTYEDYEIDTLNYGWSRTLDANMSFKIDNIGDTYPYYSTFKPQFNKETDIIYFYAELQNSNDYVLCATHDLRDNSVWFDSNYVVSVEPSTHSSYQIVFVDNVTGYKVKYDSSYYYTNIELCLNAHLKHSEYVDNYCADKMSIMWANTARGEFFDNRGETPQMVFSGDRTDWNYASETVIVRDSWINKKVISATNNTKKKTYTIGWEVEMDERIKINDEPWEDVLQESGIFYDLLPSGAVLDKKSVTVKVNGYYSDTYETRKKQDKISSGTYLKDNEIEVITIPNYKDTGRTLLIVKMPEANNYQLTYDTFHHWDSIKDFGDFVYNPIAYETGNEKIYKGSNNDGGNLEEKELMSNLGDNENSAPTFIYSEAMHDILALTSAVSGLTKKVKDEKDKDYTYDAWTKNNGSYSYRLRYQNTFNNTAKNLIFFDSLENYIVDGNASDWYGSIESFDVAQLRAMGVEPKIYLSTIANFDLEQYNTFTDFDDVLLNGGDWTKLEDFGDLSNAKAYAIDCRKKTDGSDFVLDEGQSIQAVIYMRAPAGADDVNGTGLDYPETYNNIYIRNTITGIDGTPVDFYIHQDYTTVRFIVKNDISLEKVSSENIDTKLKDIKFRLTGTSDYGTEVDIIKTTDRNGQIKFEDIEKGTYILQEYETTKDWLLDTTEHIVKINSDGTVTIDNEDYTNKQITLENKPRIYTEVYLMKRREGDGADDIEEKMMLANADIGDEVEYKGNMYEVIDKKTSKIKLDNLKIKYAVQIYGIGHDDLSDDGGVTTYKSGLTFGPAIGANYAKSFKSHVPSGQTDGSMSINNEPHNHRCVHDDNWETIVYWNSVDPQVYEQCIAENCTHSVELRPSNYFINTKYRDIYRAHITGDGPGSFGNEIKEKHKMWNGKLVAGNWGESRIRAMLNGYDELTSDKANGDNDSVVPFTTNEKVDSYTNYTAAESLISFFPKELQNIIGKRKTAYDSVYNRKTEENLKYTYDKLWLLSPNEISENVSSPRYKHPLEAINGQYERFNNQTYPIGAGANDYYRIYMWGGRSGVNTGYIWTRSNSTYDSTSSVTIDHQGDLRGRPTNYPQGVSPCFALKREFNDNQISDDGFWVNTEIKPQTPIANTTFKLSGTSDYGNDVLQILTTNSAGRLIFEDIEKGTYELREVSPNEDFILNETVWLVTIGEDRSVTVVAKEDEKDRLYEVGKDDTGRYNVVYNEPRYWNFTLRKIDKENETIWLEGATFSLKGISDLGTEYDLEANSNENGRVIFNRIEKGTYLLTETKAPSGVDETGRVGGNRNYIADSKQYIVKIDYQGNVTIDGLSMNEYDDFEVKNDRALDGKITIIKKWEDIDPNKRVAPVVHLSTGEPEGLARTVVTYITQYGEFSDGKTVNRLIYTHKLNGGNIESTLIEGEYQTPVLEDYSFEDWYTDSEYKNKWDGKLNSEEITVYAKMRPVFLTKLSVQIYDIGYDVDEDHNIMGLTFGPTLGYDTYNSYVSHIPTGKTSDGNLHRCIHNDDWETIVYWNNIDPYVYEQCIKENCTHSIKISRTVDKQKQDSNENYNFIYNGSPLGDGVSGMYYEIKNEYYTDPSQTSSYNYYGSEGGGVHMYNRLPIELRNALGNIKCVYVYKTNDQAVYRIATIYSYTPLLTVGKTAGDVSKTSYGMSPIDYAAEGPQYYKFKLLYDIDQSTLLDDDLKPFSFVIQSGESASESVVYERITLKSGDINRRMIQGLLSNGNLNSVAQRDRVATHVTFALNSTYFETHPVREPDVSGLDNTQVLQSNNLLSIPESTSEQKPESFLEKIGLVNRVFAEGEDIASGTYDNVDWRITAEGELILGKEGEVQEFKYRSRRSNSNYPWFRIKNINSVSFADIVKGNGSMAYMFNVNTATTIDLSLFDMSNVTDMTGMFQNSDVTTITFPENIGSTVTNMRSMFSGCESLTSLNLSSFNTSNVTDMSGMFNNCSSLTSLNLSNFETSNVTNMSQMFRGCRSLTSLDLSSFNTSNVTNMSEMFNNCKSLTSLDLSNFNTSHVTDMRAMFVDFTYSRELDISEFDMSNVTTVYRMFSRSVIDNVKFKNNLDLSSCLNYGYMFDNATIENLTFDFNDIIFNNSENRINMEYMFNQTKMKRLVFLQLFDKDVYCHKTLSNIKADILEIPKIDINTFQGNLKNIHAKEVYIYDLTLNENSYVRDQIEFSRYLEKAELHLNNHKVFLTNNNGNTNNLDLGHNIKELIVYGQFNGLSIQSLEYLDISNANIISEDRGIDISKCPKLKQLKLGNNKLDDYGGWPGDYFEYNNNLEYFSSNIEINCSDRKYDNKNPNIDFLHKESKEAYNLSKEMTLPAGTYIRTSLLEPIQRPDGTYEWVSIDELWTDNGDGTWSYTFDVFDDSLTYYFWEEDMEGYESDIEWIPGYKVLNGSEGTIGYITNRSTEYGALDVYKEVEWVDEANPDLKFEFTITLSGSGIGGTQVFSDVIFNDGVGKIILKDGEHKLIEGLPDGTTYLVEEKEMTLFNTTSENEAGEISTGETEYVVFNNKEKKLRELRPEGDVAIRKKVVGSNKEDSYVVYGEFSNLDASMTYLTNSDLVLTSDSTGKASIEFNILPDQEIVFYGLPVGAKYQFIEEAGNYISSYEILPVEEGDSINANNSASANTKENVQLSTAEETLEENESAVVVFTNRYTVKQNLKIKKVVDGIQADKDNSYNFEIYFSNMEPLSYFNSDIGRIVADEDGEAVKGFSITDRQEIVFEEIPIGVNYQVKELSNNTYASFLITDENGGSNIVQSEKENNTVKTEILTEVETVDENEEATITFTNTSEIIIKLKKQVEGNMGNKNDKFKFYVTIGENPEEVVELSHGEEKEYKMKHGTPYSIREEDYSSTGYRTYVGNSIIPSRNTSGTSDKNKEVIFRNVRGAAIPTEVRFYWWAGIPIILVPILWFIYKKKYKKDM